MKLTFVNGAEVDYLNAIEAEEFWGGSSRRTLTFTCAPGAIGLDALNGILNDEANTQSLTCAGEITWQNEAGEAVTSPVQNLYEGYVLKLDVAVRPELVAAESPEAPASYRDRIVFKLGKRTYIEQALKALGLL